MSYIVRYTYDNPSGAGPFKGKSECSSKQFKGEGWYGPFGAATIVSCTKKRDSNVRTFQQVCDDQLNRRSK